MTASGRLLVPIALHELDVISSDAAQIGFLGVPLVVIGAVVGALHGATEVGCGDVAVPPAGLGFVVGVIAGGVLGASAVAVPALPILVVPFAVVASVAFAVLVHLRALEHGRQPRWLHGSDDDS